MSARTGQMRRRVIIEAPQRASDGAGGFNETWASVATVWARVHARGGAERMRADRLASIVSHDITIRWRAGVLPTMRIRFGQRVVEIIAKVEDERRRVLICECEERDL
ncbi:MAG: phage head closure protein [Hyphomicrobiales bacterium]|nr:phage head closure protein [Hyphomicrobiales bacterium]